MSRAEPVFGTESQTERGGCCHSLGAWAGESMSKTCAHTRVTHDTSRGSVHMSVR